MKYIPTIVLLLISFTSFSQETGFYYGTRVSLGESTISGGGLASSQGKLYVQFGGASAFQFTNNFGITADFLVTGEGDKGSGTTEVSTITGPKKYAYDEKISLLTGQIPFCAKVSLPFKGLYFKAYGGPSINYSFAGGHTKTYADENYNQDHGIDNVEIKTLETMYTGLTYGAGIDVKANDGRLFFLDIRVSKSMKDIGTLNGQGMQTSSFALSAGYLFH